MKVKAIKIVIAFLLATALSGTSAAEQPVQALVYCQAWANLPYVSGSNVKGKGGVTCTQTVGRIRVVVQVRDRNHNPFRVTTPAVEKICYNVDKCTATATLSLGGHSDHWYDTATSGYVGTWDGGYQSNQIQLP